MTLQLEIQCPQCGGNNSFPETTYVFRCRFCASALHISGRREILSYCIQSRYSTADVIPAINDALVQDGIKGRCVSTPRLVYVPFWRLRAMIFNWLCDQSPTQSSLGAEYDKKMRTASLDLTFPATPSFDTGIQSLGVRTHALTVRFFDPSIVENAVTIPAETSARDALRKAGQEIDEKIFRSRPGAMLFDTRITARMLSLVYFPCYVALAEEHRIQRSIVFDALAGRIVREVDAADEKGLKDIIQQSGGSVAERSVDFLPFRCPHCGWDLQEIPYNRVHICRTCQMAWMEEKGTYREIAYDIVEPQGNSGKDIQFLPFWKIRTAIDFDGSTITGAEEFLRRAARILFQSSKPAPGPLHFFIPAFRVKSPEAASKAAVRLTRLQPPVPISHGGDCSKSTFAGAFVDAKGAAEMIPVVFLALLPETRKAFLAFQKSRISPKSARLTYFPFEEDGGQLREPISGAIVEK